MVLRRSSAAANRCRLMIVHCPLGSLPLALKTDASNIPADIPYLRAAGPRLDKWRPRLEALPSPRIALAWSGSGAHPNDRNRSLSLAQLEPLLSAPGVSFVSVQRELRAGDADALSRDPRILNLGPELDDFADTAAVLTLADLVICVDTSVAHVAGALGRPVFVLLPFQPDWRWMLDRDTSPWYPAMRLFRQAAPGDWNGVIARVRSALPSTVAQMTRRHPVPHRFEAMFERLGPLGKDRPAMRRAVPTCCDCRWLITDCRRERHRASG